MAWYNNVTLFGPRRSPFDKSTNIGDADGLSWRALVDILEEGTPATPKWRHLFLENNLWTPALHDQIRLGMPGTSIVRAKVKKVSVFLFGIEFTYSLSAECTLLVVSIPRDDHGAAHWGLAHSGGEHVVTRTPILLCTGGAIPVAPTSPNWTNPLSEWGTIDSASLVLHASGLAFDGVPKFAWTTAGKSARFNIVFPRQVDGRTASAKLPLIIEPDRQWLFSDFKVGGLDAVAAMKDLRAKFGELDRILRQTNQVPSKKAQWVQLGVKNPDGPPLFDWLVYPTSLAKTQFRFRRGELSMTLTDQFLDSGGWQAPNEKVAIPRTTATVDGNVSIVSTGTTGGPAAFRLEMQAVRELSVASPESGADLLKNWVGLLSFDRPEVSLPLGSENSGRLRWFLGREMTKTHATALRADFSGAGDTVVKAIETLIAAATVHVNTPVTIAFPSSLANRVEIRGQTLSWFGVGVHGTDSLLAIEDPQYTQLKALRDSAIGRRKEVLSELCRRIDAIVTYENATAETVEWQALETTYDANDVAAFLRDVQRLHRPDPDEVSPGGVVGRYQVDPPILWGTSPLETGWVTLPYFNVTEELYLRVIEPEVPEPEAALVNGAAIWGNDDPRLWFDASAASQPSFLGNQQRWSLTFLDADLVRGGWSFVAERGQITLKEARVRFYQPEVAFGGMFWIARRAPTLEDSLPDPSSWPNLLRSFSLRSPRTKESFPSPYLFWFPGGKMTRIEAPSSAPINSYARLDHWTIRIESNAHPVTIPTKVPGMEVSLSLTAATLVPSIPKSTDALSMVRRIRWPANKILTSEAISHARLYVETAEYRPDFRRAARSFRERIDKLGAGKESPIDIIEEFVFSDGNQPLDMGVPYPLLETALVWKGGRLDEASKKLLADWEQNATYTAAVHRLQAGISNHVDEHEAIFDTFIKHDFWKQGLKDIPSPLLWQRHPSLPFIQSLPLTQSLNPPSSPSASRQLAPFDLIYSATPQPNPPEPSSWVFGVTPSQGVNAARQWGVWLGAPLQPAKDWKNARFDGQLFLPMVSLSLPGLTAHPTTDPTIAPLEDSTKSGLRLQWFHCLPYLDEKCALAQLPREEGLADVPVGTSGSPRAPLDDRTGDQVGAKAPTPLKRETFGQAWSELSELARLAAVDVASGLSFVADGKQALTSLIEQFSWNVKATLSDVAFPGTLRFEDLSTGALPLELSEPISDSATNTPPLPPGKHSALRGIQGSFDVPSGNSLRLVSFAASDKAQFDVVAGTLRAKLDAVGRLRDQRGLFRSPTLASQQWLRTPVNDLKKPVVLWTSLSTIGLGLGAFGDWNLWLSNLPVEKIAGGPPETGAFRSQRSAQSEDINDPSALRPLQGHLQGYEWRLSGTGNDAQLFFGRLPFFPLVLKLVETSDDHASKVEVTKVEITGRLQLRLATQQKQDGAPAIAERDHESNVVRITFETVAGKLTLTTIAIEPPDELFFGEKAEAELVWPLSEGPGAPVLRIAGRKDADSERRLIDFDLAGKLKFDGICLDFSFLGVRWTPAVQPITILVNKPSVSLKFAPLPTVTTAVAIDAIGAALELQSGEHSLAVVLRGIWGDRAGTFVKALKTLTFLPKPGSTIDGVMVSKTNELKLNGIKSAGVLDQQEVLNPAIQLTWSGLTPATAQDVAFFVLPGFGVSRDVCKDSTPGYASIEFTAVGADPKNPPVFERIVGASELVFSCSWGKALQEFAASDPVWVRTQRAFGSSAGSVSVSVLFQVSQPDPVQFSMQLNGLIEVKNLTSWPIPSVAESTPDNAQITLTKFTNDLSHWRHTVRILLNQVNVPFQVLGPVDNPAGEPFTMFGFTGDKPFQFLAVVEHQIAELDMQPVSMANPATIRSVPREFRWAATQEVRLAAPNTLAAFWKRFLPTAALETPRTIDTTQDRQGLLSPVRRVALGWLREGLLTTMLGSDRDGLTKLASTTVCVEMSAAFYLPRAVPRALPGKSANFANVQLLPGEIDQAIPISLDDLIPPTDLGNNDRDPWGLAVVPFVGRIQPETRDGLSTEGTIDFSSAATLRIDPVLWLTQPVANRPRYLPDLTSRLEQNTTVTLAPFDRLWEQKWSSLDPASLEAGLFRIMTPPPETGDASSSGLTSIMAAAPPGGLGGLSRPAALQQGFDPELRAYPPQSQLVDDPTDDWQWRYGALFVLQARIVGTTPPTRNLDASFFAVGKRLAQIIEGGKNPTGFIRLPGLTILPPRLDQPEAGFSQNVSFATSPYLAIRRLPLAQTGEKPVLKVVAADVVAASQAVIGSSPNARRASVVASQLWQQRFREDSGTVVRIPMPDDDEITAWADMSRRGLANDSLVAIVRIREVSEAPISKTPMLKFRFCSLPRANPIPLLSPLTRSIRPELGALRAREGQFGGSVMPIDFSAIALAPPQVDDVEPIHFETPPAISDPKFGETLKWDWGYSGMRFSLNYADGRVGQAGPPLGDHQKAWQKLTWMASPHPVQFSDEKIGSTTILPKNFRAPAIRSFLPAPPGIPCPKAAEILATARETASDPGPNDEPWQPVLPGDQQMLLIGGRPGAYTAARPQLLTQTESIVLQWTFEAGWEVGDKAIVTCGGSTLTVAAASIVISDIIDQVVTAVSADAGFAHLRGRRIGDLLEIRFVQASPSLDRFIINIRAVKRDGTDAPALLTASRQEARAALASGSIPVQHRWPRPVHIPANRVAKPDVVTQLAALAPWGSWFDLNAGEANDRSVDNRLDPHDALFVMNGPEAFGLDVELQPLVVGEHGQLSDRWSEPFMVTLRLVPRPIGVIHPWQNLAKDKLKLTLRSADSAVRFDCVTDDASKPMRVFSPADGAAGALRTMIRSAAHGDLLWFELRVEVEDFGIQGPPVTATLPVRRIDSKELPLPYVSTFCLFEDPEYSRRLASPTTRCSKSVRKLGATDAVEVTLSLDRQEYNPSTKFFLAVDVDKVSPQFDLMVRRISVLGLENTISPNRTAANAPVGPIVPNTIIDLQFGTKASSSSTSLCYDPALIPGDRLEFEIKASSTLERNAIVAAVQIVRDPITPPPEAAYALLRQLGATATAAVECVRFAWSPSAQRIEFVDPGDLRRDSVRRRAVFLWQDTVRPGGTPRYGLQKIVPSGSTLIPKLLTQ